LLLLARARERGLGLALAALVLKPREERRAAVGHLARGEVPPELVGRVGDRRLDLRDDAVVESRPIRLGPPLGGMRSREARCSGLSTASAYRPPWMRTPRA
jgi:hypothetical protein